MEKLNLTLSEKVERELEKNLQESLKDPEFCKLVKRLKLNNNLTTYSKEYNGRLRKYYKITEKGKKRLLDCQEDFKQIKSIYEFILGGNDNE